MLKVVIYINGHNKVLGLVRKAQLSEGVKVPLSLLKSADTRWSTHYLAAKRLLQLEPIIKQVSRHNEFSPSKGTREQKATAKKVVCIVRDNLFWSTLKDTSRILMPIAALSNILQRKNLRLDSMFIAISKVYNDFHKLANRSTSSPLIVAASKLLLTILEKRWAPLDHELIVTAVLLNPFIGRMPSSAFNPNSKLSNENVYLIIPLLERVEQRLFPGDTTSNLSEEYVSYFFNEGNHSDEKLCQNVLRAMSVSCVSIVL